MRFTPTKTREGFKVVGVITAMSIFQEVEDILGEVYLKYNIEEPLFTLHYNSKRDDSIADIEIKDSSDLKKITSWLKKTILDDCIRFLNDTRNLEDLYKRIIQTEDLTEILYRPADIRAMIVYGLVNSPKYDSYSEEVVDFYKQQAQDPYKVHFERYSLFLEDLLELVAKRRK